MKISNQRLILGAVVLLILVFLAFRFWPDKQTPDNQPEINKANDSAAYYAEQAEIKEILRKNAENEAEIKRLRYELLRDPKFKADHPDLWADMRKRNRQAVFDSIDARHRADSIAEIRKVRDGT